MEIDSQQPLNKCKCKRVNYLTYIASNLTTKETLGYGEGAEVICKTFKEEFDTQSCMIMASGEGVDGSYNGDGRPLNKNEVFLQSKSLI